MSSDLLTFTLLSFAMAPVPLQGASRSTLSTCPKPRKLSTVVVTHCSVGTSHALKVSHERTQTFLLNSFANIILCYASTPDTSSYLLEQLHVKDPFTILRASAMQGKEDAD